MRVFLCAFLTLAACAVVSSYIVEFNNNFEANAGQGGDRWEDDKHEVGKHEGGKSEGGKQGNADKLDSSDDNEDEELDQFIIGLDSVVDKDSKKFTTIHSDLVEAIGKHGGCSIEIIDLPPNRCLDNEEDTEVPFRMGHALGTGVVDGCFGFYGLPELGWVGEVSEPYFDAGEVQLRLVAGKELKDLTEKDTVLYPSLYSNTDSDAEQLAYRVQQLVGPKVEVVRWRDVEWNKLKDAIDTAVTGGKIVGVYMRKAHFDLLGETGLVVANSFELPNVGVLATWRGTGLTECFNKGMAKFVKSGDYTKWCEANKQDIKENYQYDCLDSS